MVDELLHDARILAEGKLNWLRINTPTGYPWLNEYEAPEISPSRHDVLQTVLLYKILDTLESIDANLASMSNDSWSDHHNK